MSVDLLVAVALGVVIGNIVGTAIGEWWAWRKP
jgi:predicted MFS family arabinose efflux permease